MVWLVWDMSDDCLGCTRKVVALRAESLMLMELRFVMPNGALPGRWGMRYQRRMAVNGGHIDGDRCEDRCVMW
jgi:hypothetical protein